MQQSLHLHSGQNAYDVAGHETDPWSRMSLNQLLLYLPALLTGPSLSVFLLFVYWRRRAEMSTLASLVIIPIALTSIAVELGQSTETILDGMVHISEQKATGMRAFAQVFIDAQQALIFGLLACAACLIMGAIFDTFVRFAAKQSTPLSRSFVSTRSVIICAVALLLVGLLVLHYQRTVDLFMLFADRNRSVEAARAGITVSQVATTLTYRLASIGISAKIMIVVLIAIAFRSWTPDQRRTGALSATILLTVVALSWCGVEITRELTYMKYLKQFERQTTENAASHCGNSSRAVSGSRTCTQLDTLTKRSLE